MKTEDKIAVMIALLDEKKQLHDDLKLIDRTIESLQRRCRHQYDGGSSAKIYINRDHNYRYYQCVICKKDFQE